MVPSPTTHVPYMGDFPPEDSDVSRNFGYIFSPKDQSHEPGTVVWDRPYKEFNKYGDEGPLFPNPRLMPPHSGYVVDPVMRPNEWLYWAMMPEEFREQKLRKDGLNRGYLERFHYGLATKAWVDEMIDNDGWTPQRADEWPEIPTPLLQALQRESKLRFDVKLAWVDYACPRPPADWRDLVARVPFRDHPYKTMRLRELWDTWKAEGEKKLAEAQAAADARAEEEAAATLREEMASRAARASTSPRVQRVKGGDLIGQWLAPLYQILGERGMHLVYSGMIEMMELRSTQYADFVRSREEPGWSVQVDAELGMEWLADLDYLRRFLNETSRLLHPERHDADPDQWDGPFEHTSVSLASRPPSRPSSSPRLASRE